VSKLGLTPALIRGLSTTNIIENPNGAGRVKRCRDAGMA
jgi:putative transposase